jgi:hypothetical protein
MAIPAPLGLTGFGTPVKGDQATAVASGSFTAVGASIPFAFYGLANFSLYCEVVDLLTTTQGTFTATVTGATSGLIAAGTAIRTSLFQNGTIFSAFSGGSGTLLFQPICFYANVTALSNIVTGNFVTDGFFPGVDLTGAAISGLGIQPGTTITKIVNHSNQLFENPALTPNIASIMLSLPATITSDPRLAPGTALTITPTANMVPTSSANSFFTGSTIAYTGSVQLEKSFDGGASWIVANIGPAGSGAMAIYQNAASVSFSLYEPERQVLYRWNCTSITLTGTESIQYRISQTGSLNQSSPLIY